MVARDNSILKEDDYSLKVQLESLGQLELSGLELVIKDAKGEWYEGKNVRTQVFNHFYEQNPLAYAVAQGKESYVKQIEFIEEKYDTVWKKLRSSQPDIEFDKNVHEVIGSLNSVGVGLNSAYMFESGGLWRGYYNFHALPIVGLAAGICGVGAIALKSDFSLAVGAATLGAAVGWGLRVPYNRVCDIDRLLGKLHDAAQQTDDFLRRNYALREM